MNEPTGDDVVLVRHTASGMYLTADEEGGVELAPLTDSSAAGHRWTCQDERIAAQRTGAPLSVDEGNRAVTRGGAVALSYRGGRLGTGQGGFLAPGEDGGLHVTATPGSESEVMFELVPQPRSGDGTRKHNKRPKVKTNEDLKTWMPIVGKVVEGAIAGGFSAAGVPGGGLLGAAFSTYWNWFSSQVMNEESVETKMEHIMDWVEHYVFEKIDDVVRGEIQASYMTFQQAATRYRQALLNYNKATDPGKKTEFRNELKSEYKHCRGAIDNILNRCESYSTEYAKRFILVYTVVMSFYLTLMRDMITNAKELGYQSEQIGPMKDELQKRADKYFPRMQEILNGIRLLYFWKGQTRKDCHIGKDPNFFDEPDPTKSKDTADTLFMIQIVMKIMRSLLYYNPKYYKHNIALATGSGELSDNGYDAQVRLTPETKILQCLHLPKEWAGLVEKTSAEKTVRITMKCTKEHKIGLRAMFATVHSTHTDAKYQYQGEKLPNSIKVNGKDVTGTKEFERQFRLIFDDTSDDNRYFWNRKGVEEGFDADNYVKYRYLSLGEYDLKPNASLTLTLPAGSRPVFVDAYFVDWQPDPKPPKKEFIKDTEGNDVDRNNFYHLVSENDGRYLAPDDDTTPKRLVTAGSKPKVQIKFTRDMTDADYRSKLKYGDVVLLDFVKSGYPGYRQIPVRIKDNGEFDANGPKWFVLTEQGLLQVKDSDKKLAKQSGADNVLLSASNESNLYWKFEKHK